MIWVLNVLLLTASGEVIASAVIGGFPSVELCRDTGVRVIARTESLDTFICVPIGENI